MSKDWKSIYNNSIGTPREMSVEAKRKIKNVRTLSPHELKEHNDNAYAAMVAKRNYETSKAQEA